MDFKFIEDPLSKKWVISAPRRAKRPSEHKGTEPSCPFCVGNKFEDEVYRIGGVKGDDNWKVMVVSNKFPFAPIHEVIIHSTDHHKSFDELPLSQSELVFQAFRQRVKLYKDKGTVYIFNNHGENAGESLPHPHSQLVVIPDHVKLEFPHHEITEKDKTKETSLFTIFCPYESKWPEEIWLYPKNRGRSFAEITDEEIRDLAKSLYKIIQIMDLRHGHEFPYNFGIYPYKDWYLRIVPRLKIFGGFEVGTEVFVNTQDPNNTIEFIIEHFDSPDEEKIKTTQKADYARHS